MQDARFKGVAKGSGSPRLPTCTCRLTQAANIYMCRNVHIHTCRSRYRVNQGHSRATNAASAARVVRANDVHFKIRCQTVGREMRRMGSPRLPLPARCTQPCGLPREPTGMVGLPRPGSGARGRPQRGGHGTSCLNGKKNGPPHARRAASCRRTHVRRCIGVCAP